MHNRKCSICSKNDYPLAEHAMGSIPGIITCGISLEWGPLSLKRQDLINPLSVATDLIGTHDTSLDVLPPLYSVESAHL